MTFIFLNTTANLPKSKGITKRPGGGEASFGAPQSEDRGRLSVQQSVGYKIGKVASCGFTVWYPIFRDSNYPSVMPFLSLIRQ